MAGFNRSKPKFKPQPKVLVICEDSKSGKKYLEDASFGLRANVPVKQVRIEHHSPAPLKIVEHAVKQTGKYDDVYCVIDRDTHETFDEALKLAKTSAKIKIIASYPCYEFWLLLHFIHPNDLKEYKPIGKLSPADVLIKDLCRCEGMENYEKGDDKNLFEYLRDKGFSKAKENSPLILANAKARGKMNPSTQLHELIDYFEVLSQPQRLKK